MALRRMFSLTVVDTDRFLEMPSTARLLYYDLGMRADDDGFVASPRKVMRMIGASDDDLKLLLAKGYAMLFDSGVCVIVDWKQNNYIRSDRYAETLYKSEKAQLSCDNNGSYIQLLSSGIPPGIPNGNQVPTTGIHRLGKDRKEIGEYESTYAQKPDDLFNSFWTSYPKKKSKGDAEKAWKAIKPSKELVAKMLETLARATTCREWLKDNGQYIPYPASWLRAKGWEDEYTQSAYVYGGEYGGDKDGDSL